jgi:hypothetical protein
MEGRKSSSGLQRFLPHRRRPVDGGLPAFRAVPPFVWYSKRREFYRMDITSPFFVVPIFVLVFAASILFATSSKEDGHHASH